MPSFFTAYVNAALWSSTDDHGEPMNEKYSITDIASDTIGKMKDDCDKFQRANLLDLQDIEDADAGHDFWLTRNGHGAGFWDGDYEEAIGERLTKSAKSFGTFELYIGDDGKIHGV